MSGPLDNASRRAVMAAAAASLVAATAPARAAPRELKLTDLKKEADVACVYHCDYGDPARFTQTLSNISNHYAAYGADPFALQIALVAHGPGVKFFLASLAGTPWKAEALPADIEKQIEGVAKTGLKIHLCENTFGRLKLDKAAVRDAEFVSFVPSGVATIAALQSKGFAYMKIG